MKPELTETPLSERKVVRRGLIAGLAGFGAAALLKLSGAGKVERAEAAATALVYSGAGADPEFTNTAFKVTNLKTAATFSGFEAFRLDATPGPTAGRTGLHVLAGGNSGYGVISLGSGSGAGVNGIGGSADAGFNGGDGAEFSGGNGGSGANGGHGVTAFGGSGVKSGDGLRAGSSTGKGVFGSSLSSDGVHGTSTNGVGLRGTSPNFVGLVGISDQYIGLYGYNAAPSVPAFYAESLAASNRIAGQFNGAVQVFGNFTVMPGFAKNAAVTMPDGSDAVLYCQESPEPYFEDFGRARLVNGVAHVQLEPEFASIVKRDDYMVFPVPEGDTKGLFISQRSSSGFEVREAQGGTSSIPFTYRIVARRKDIEGKRLERLDPKIKANLAQMRASAAAKNHPAAKIPPGGNPLVPLEPIPPMPESPAQRHGP